MSTIDISFSIYMEETVDLVLGLIVGFRRTPCGGHHRLRSPSEHCGWEIRPQRPPRHQVRDPRTQRLREYAPDAAVDTLRIQQAGLELGVVAPHLLLLLLVEAEHLDKGRDDRIERHTA